MKQEQQGLDEDEQDVETLANWHEGLERFIDKANNLGVSMSLEGYSEAGDHVRQARQHLDKAQDSLISSEYNGDESSDEVYQAWNRLVHTGGQDGEIVATPNHDNPWFSLYQWLRRTGDDVLQDQVKHYSKDE